MRRIPAITLGFRLISQLHHIKINSSTQFETTPFDLSLSIYPYGSPRSSNPESPKKVLHHFSCVAFFCVGLTPPLAWVVLLAFSMHPKGLHDLSPVIEIAIALLNPLGRCRLSAVIFGLYSMVRSFCQRSVILWAPLFTAGLLFPFATWLVCLLDFALTRHSIWTS